jgi:hypothetical protein
MQASVMRIRITPPRIRMRMSALSYDFSKLTQHTKQRPYLLVEDNITHKGACREGSEYEKQRI